MRKIFWLAIWLAAFSFHGTALVLLIFFLALLDCAAASDQKSFREPTQHPPDIYNYLD